jgi:hypothetical protein
MLKEIAIVVVAILVLTIFTIFTSIFVVSSPAPPAPSPSPSPSPSPPTPSPPLLSWSENIRGNQNATGGFPPCYTDDSYAKRIYGIIASMNMTQRYYSLIDLLSILLCANQCDRLHLKDRMTQIVGMGGNADDNDIKYKAMNYIPVNETLPSRFIVASMYLIERQVKLIENDSSISVENKDLIKGNIYSFYVRNLSSIYKTCSS